MTTMNTTCGDAVGWTALVAWRGDRAHRAIASQFVGIRITPNIYTTLVELDRFCEVTTELAKSGLPV
jgi:hypothetical protein